MIFRCVAERCVIAGDSGTLDTASQGALAGAEELFEWEGGGQAHKDAPNAHGDCGRYLQEAPADGSQVGAGQRRAARPPGSQPFEQQISKGRESKPLDEPE
jgi:hypothetical protein